MNRLSVTSPATAVVCVINSLIPPFINFRCLQKKAHNQIMIGYCIDYSCNFCAEPLNVAAAGSAVAAHGVTILRDITISGFRPSRVHLIWAISPGHPAMRQSSVGMYSRIRSTAGAAPSKQQLSNFSMLGTAATSLNGSRCKLDRCLDAIV